MDKKTYTQYYNEISAWDWEKIIQDLNNSDDIIDPYTDCIYKSIFLGSILNLCPSGKYYTFWTSNQNSEDSEEDEKWWDAFTKVLNNYNLYYESGEGDPCDIFISKYIGKTYEESEEEND